MAGSSFAIRSASQIIQDIVAYTVANNASITDMSPGSVIRSYCEGTGVALEELYVEYYLGLRRELATVPQTVFQFQQKAGLAASANVVYSVSIAPGSNVTIPIGAIVKTAQGLAFATTAVGTILSGQTSSGSIPVVAQAVGAAYNVGPGTITVIGTSIAGTQGLTVTNAVAATGGQDAESAYAFNSRFQNYIQGLAGSNIAGLITAALSVSTITSASVVENFPPVGNVNANVYVDNGQQGGVSAGVVAQVQAALNGNGTTSNPGARAGGVNVVAVAAAVVTQNIVMLITSQLNSSPANIVSDTNAAISAYINSLPIGGTIVWASLVAAVMGVKGVKNVSITTPSSDVAVSATQVARVGTITITVQ